jgi:hypothetical protein
MAVPEWTYQLDVFSIVSTKSPTTEMFLAEPEKIISDLAELW